MIKFRINFSNLNNFNSNFDKNMTQKDNQYEDLDLHPTSDAHAEPGEVINL